ncbi:MAG: hypothetical protein VBE63_11465 [Lamprobacter sp.]|uniref:hypothetical protein n=1 Tax=Lamprobacter sp. TaxID=3100796 RepID=UPI002B2636D4|nr:hypothetical protein [Lamprobacter sp.]MEA3640547.1 hypothetical protein [Lamprobacter sp.]
MLVDRARRAVARIERQQPQLTRLLQPSDPIAFCGILRTLKSQYRLRGKRFCEWGSGVGLLTALAALNGLEAIGIEADATLVKEAQKTFPPTDRGPRFAQGSFVPPQVTGHFQVVGTYGATIWKPSTERDPYAAFNRSCTDFDLIYAYPWPREIGLYEALFERCAGNGALLWLFIQGEAPRLLEKIASPNPTK